MGPLHWISCDFGAPMNDTLYEVVVPYRIPRGLCWGPFDEN